MPNYNIFLSISDMKTEISELPNNGLSERKMLDKVDRNAQLAIPRRLRITFRYDACLLDNAQNTVLSVNENRSAFYMLSYHLDYLQAAASDAKFPKIVAMLNNTEGRQKVLEYLDEHMNTWFTSTGEAMGKDAFLLIELNINENGGLGWGATKLKISVPSHALFPSSLDIPLLMIGSSMWEVYLHPDPADPSSSRFAKASSRHIHEVARHQAGIKNIFEEKEILLGNNSGKLFGGSAMLVLCERDGRWVTPRLDDGADNTAIRRWVLEKGLGKEESVEVISLKNGELLWLGNEMTGFHLGRLRL